MKSGIAQALIEARKSKNLTLTQVAKDTKISVRNLQALEEENFESFPGETYVIGFLRNYGNYLGLDPTKLIQKYKSQMMMDAPSPLKELTEKPIHLLDYIMNYSKYILLGAIPLLLIAFGYMYWNSASEIFPKKTVKNSNLDFNIDTYLKNSGKLPDEKTDSVNFANGILVALIRVGEGIDFPLKGKEVYLVLKSLEYKSSSKASKASVEAYPGKQLISLGEDDVILDFPWLPEKLKLGLIGGNSQ